MKLSQHLQALKFLLKGRPASLIKPHLGGYKPGGDYATHIPPLFSILKNEGVKSCLDVGCGDGSTMKTMIDLGYSNVIGLEGLKKAKKESPVPERIIIHDLTDGIYVFPDKFDLVYSSEVAEHIPENFVGNYLVTLVANSSKFIAITAAEPGQGGFHHVNCKPKSYWINLIEKLSFTYDHELTLSACEAIKAECKGFRHFLKTGMIFRRVY